MEILILFIIALVILHFCRDDDCSGSCNTDNKTIKCSSKIDSGSNKHNLTLNNDSKWAKLRQEAFATYGDHCGKCGATKNLQIHHKIPLYIGGTNNIGNLSILCESCHENLHGKSFSYNDNKDIENYGFDENSKNRRTGKIKSAIELNKDIVITYEKYEGEQTTRKISPKEMYEKNGRFYLKGYCHLRNTDRTFRISRIKRISNG